MHERNEDGRLYRGRQLGTGGFTRRDGLLALLGIASAIAGGGMIVHNDELANALGFKDVYILKGVDNKYYVQRGKNVYMLVERKILKDEGFDKHVIELNPWDDPDYRDIRLLAENINCVPDVMTKVKGKPILKGLTSNGKVERRFKYAIEKCVPQENEIYLIPQRLTKVESLDQLFES